LCQDKKWNRNFGQTKESINSRSQPGVWRVAIFIHKSCNYFAACIKKRQTYCCH